jgi:hypothetical protein
MYGKMRLLSFKGHWHEKVGQISRVVDPDPDWIRIQWLVCIRIRNPDQDPWARKMKKKMYFSLTF